MYVKMLVPCANELNFIFCENKALGPREIRELMGSLISSSLLVVVLSSSLLVHRTLMGLAVPRTPPDLVARLDI